MKKKLLVSVSGGRTSALMAYMLYTRFWNKGVYDIIFVFANTSREKEETLEFVRDLEINYGIPIVWVEAMVHHAQRKASTHKIVNFGVAKRKGEVFEEVIKKYGIPCVKFLHCTRELKSNPIKSYAKSIGWKDYELAIGYRKDEPKRVNLVKAKAQRQWYPLWEWGIKKTDVANFWNSQPFDLGLTEEWQGNCKLCYKKSKRKLIIQIQAEPESAEWVVEMESRYEDSKEGKIQRFFRGGDSIHDLIELSSEPLPEEPDYDLDEQEDCAESCEPF